MTKSTWVLLGTIAAVTTLEAAKERTVCNIKGQVVPAMALRNVWLINGKDTIQSRHIGSSFNLSVKPGKYTLLIDAVAPYKDHQFADILINNNNTMELGNIKLIQ